MLPVYMSRTMDIKLDKNASLIYQHNFFEDHSLNSILDEVTVKQEKITLYGKSMNIPRLTAYQGEKTYTYSNIQNPPSLFSKNIQLLKKEIVQLTGFEFNSVLINYYRDGNDSMGYHKDDEKELDHRLIASVSFGAVRKIRFKHHKDKKRTFSLSLGNASLLLMKNIQTDWYHELPKTKRVYKPRLNLTFRRII